MSIGKKKKKGKRFIWEKPAPAEAALWMQVDTRRLLNGLLFGLLLAVAVAAVNNACRLPLQFTGRVIGDTILIVVICVFFSLYLVSFETRRSRTTLPILAVAATALMPLIAALVFPSLGIHYLIPITMASMIFGIVYSERTAVGLSFMLCLLTGLTYRIANMEDVLIRNLPYSYDLLIVLFGGGAAAALGCGRIRKRSKLLKVGLISSGVQMALIAGVNMRSGRPMNPDIFWGLINGIGSAALVTAMLPIIEQVFKITTDISLLELSDQNHVLLRRLSLEAPGTYHHSLILGNVAEAAGNAIGANSLLLRVGAYFHDIGKMVKPEYFVENEGMQGSMHVKLSPTMSTLIITAHTKDGVEIAQQYGLPEGITNLIQQHHGTSKVEYFYRQALESADDKEDVDEDLFRHPGPKPQTREAGVLLLADAVESASRALPDPTPVRVARMVREIVNRKLIDGQLDECDMTLAEVHRVEHSLVRSISSVFHARIKYPDIGDSQIDTGQND